MLSRVWVEGFKSIASVDLALGPLVVLFGPNTAGKSNFLEALLVFSRFATGRTLADALEPPLRGYPVEAYSLPQDGLEGLLAQDQAELRVGGDLLVRGEERSERLRYEVTTRIEPRTGTQELADERLVALNQQWEPKHKPRIERDDSQYTVRQRRGPGAPIHIPTPINHTLLSSLQYTGDRYPDFDRVRAELANWRTYYLDPRVAMREPQPPREVTDIGVRGEWIAPFLYRLKNGHDRSFRGITRALRHTIPTIESLDVDLDPRRGILDILVRQDGTPYSSRVISEGTLRILALCAIAANPWPGSLVAFEEPENGVHPRRIDVIADLLASMAESGRQVVVTTHSPTLVGAMVRKQQQAGADQVRILRCFREGRSTAIEPFDIDVDLYADRDIRDALRGPDDEGLVEAMLLRGWLDGG